jgi:hypothetical protein
MYKRYMYNITARLARVITVSLPHRWHTSTASLILKRIENAKAFQ